MSYCRWSSMDWSCDLYCYEDVRGGWTTHVAGYRRVGVENIPKELPFDDDGWFASHQAAMKWLGAHREMKPIGLPHDGQSFNDPTLEDFRARVVALRELGYRCPDYVLTQIDEEIADAPSGHSDREE